jgi:hypothetical protein
MRGLRNVGKRRSAAEVATVRHEFQTIGPAAFCRGYLSQWPNEMITVEWRTLDEAQWTACPWHG